MAGPRGGLFLYVGGCWRLYTLQCGLLLRTGTANALHRVCPHVQRPHCPTTVQFRTRCAAGVSSAVSAPKFLLFSLFLRTKHSALVCTYAYAPPVAERNLLRERNNANSLSEQQHTCRSAFFRFRVHWQLQEAGLSEAAVGTTSATCI